MRKLIAGCCCLLFSLAITVLFTLYAINNFGQNFFQFEVPGEAGLTIHPGKDPGEVREIALWYDMRTVFTGQTFASPGELPAGVIIKMRGINSGKEFALDTKSGHTELKSGKTFRVKIGNYTLPPDNYIIKVDGLNDKRVFSLGPDFTNKLFIAILALGIFAGAPGMIGFILIILGTISIANQRKVTQHKN